VSISFNESQPIIKLHLALVIPQNFIKWTINVATTSGFPEGLLVTYQLVAVLTGDT